MQAVIPSAKLNGATPMNAAHLIMALARWTARKRIEQQVRAMGVRPQQVELREIVAASNVYLMEHQEELIAQAEVHPAAIHHRHQERIRLARRAVIAEIREKGRRVNSIAPEELHSLIRSYLKDHPEENGAIEDMIKSDRDF